MERERITSLVWRWDDSLGGAGFRVTVADYVVGMITMNLAGECWEAVPYPPGAAADENALPPRGFREINSAESYIEAHAEDADFTVLHHIAEV